MSKSASIAVFYNVHFDFGLAEEIQSSSFKFHLLDVQSASDKVKSNYHSAQCLSNQSCSTFDQLKASMILLLAPWH